MLTYVGRIAMEKNIQAFLDLDVPGTKVVVGDGPQREQLAARYPHVHWVGYKTGRDLGRHYAGSDLVVLPSKTETFGLVSLESAACGTPVAAYPVGGPGDVVLDGVSGALDEDLAVAVGRALNVSRDRCAEYAQQFTWRRCAEVFLRNVQPINVHEHSLVRRDAVTRAVGLAESSIAVTSLATRRHAARRLDAARFAESSSLPASPPMA